MTEVLFEFPYPISFFSQWCILFNKISLPLEFVIHILKEHKNKIILNRSHFIIFVASCLLSYQPFFSICSLFFFRELPSTSHPLLPHTTSWLSGLLFGRLILVKITSPFVSQINTFSQKVLREVGTMSTRNLYWMITSEFLLPFQQWTFDIPVTSRICNSNKQITWDLKA